MLIKLEDGFEVEVNRDAFNDMEALDTLTRLVDGDPFAISKVSDLIMDKNEKKRLYDHCRNEEGKVSVEDFVKVLSQIMESLGQQEKN